jgi:hypothetical protein
MVNLMAQGHIVLMQLAILAALLGALPDTAAQSCGDVPSGHNGLLRGDDCHAGTCLQQ